MEDTERLLEAAEDDVPDVTALVDGAEERAPQLTEVMDESIGA